jgi:hypothetical protein
MRRSILLVLERRNSKLSGWWMVDSEWVILVCNGDGE